MPTLILEDKFADLANWTTNGSPTVVSSPAPPSGGNALEINVLDEYVQWPIPDTGITRLVLGLWWQAGSWPVSATRAWKIDAGPTEGWVRLRPNGETQIQSDGTPSIAGFFSTEVMDIGTWRWVQLMYDVSANPWELRYRNSTGTVVSGTGAAAASNLNPGTVTLGETGGVGSATTQYFAHVKVGTAATDDDWWDMPTQVLGHIGSISGVGW